MINDISLLFQRLHIFVIIIEHYLIIMIDHLHNLASVFAFANQIGGVIHGRIQYAFDWYMDIFGKSTMLSDTVGAMCLTTTCFWLIGSLYTILDLTHWPNCLFQYKTQDKNVTVGEVLRTAKLSLFNQLTTQFLTSIGYHFLIEWRGMDNSPLVPPVATILTHLLVFAFIQETSFYYLHRLLHQGRFYRSIHKIHHYWQAPIAIAAIYCHPIEHFLANLLPVLLGPLVMGSHRSIISIWLIIVHIVTLNDHSGYHFPLMPSPEFHDYHHLKFNQNFGRMGILDYFHGTSDNYLKSKYCKRDRLLLSITPIRTLVPDKDNE